jgi:hypothetical protein
MRGWIDRLFNAKVDVETSKTEKQSEAISETPANADDVPAVSLSGDSPIKRYCQVV